MKEQRKQLVGRVTSNKMDKSIVVEVTRVTRHPLYGKVVRNHRRFMAHDEGNACAIGDVVRIVEARPMSRRKRWVLDSILEHNEA
jgi:small subunit ribosomal protein S17